MNHHIFHNIKHLPRTCIPRAVSVLPVGLRSYENTYTLYTLRDIWNPVKYEILNHCFYTICGLKPQSIIESM
jgi:hypothetical protein